MPERQLSEYTPEVQEQILEAELKKLREARLAKLTAIPVSSKNQETK